MDFQDQALELCQSIQTLSGLHCTLLDVDEKRFCSPPFRHSCTGCQALNMHHTGCREAVRWNGLYQYECREQLTFVAASLRQAYGQKEYGLIVGPFHTDAQTCGCSDIPVLTAERIKALKQVVQAVCGHLLNSFRMSVTDATIQEEALQTMYHTVQSGKSYCYPMDEERRLQHMIRVGSQQEARCLLNRILLGLYSSAGTDLFAMKARVREIITLMSRAAADSGADVHKILHLCDCSIMEMETKNSFDELNLWLADMLHRFVDLAFVPDDAKHQVLICEITSYIQEHLTERLTLEQTANAIHISKSYLCRILKEDMGCTFTEYVNGLRIELGKAYLRTTSLSLADISGSVGFDDQSYFTRVFKRLVGMTPGKYRRSNKNG